MKIQLCGVGGQGVLFASKVIGRAAMLSGLNVLSSEVHGMAQRGGVVTSTVVMGDEWSPLIGKGDADIILGFEPSETLRALDRGSKDTYIITNTREVIPFTTTLGMSTYPDIAVELVKLAKTCKAVVKFDAEEMAERAGHKQAMNIVMIGALAAVPGFPVSKEKMMDALAASFPPKTLDMNKIAFDMGYHIASEMY
jgi:indolepyruvate ferredoxin oxidoreductase beta subunit